MPSSKRPSPRAAMDDDAAAAAGLHPSSPRSKKRSSRPKARSGDRRSPNPNPNPRRRADYHGSEPSRKSERKRKPRSFPDSAPLALAVAAPASSSGGGHGAAQKLWTESDEVALLNGAISFRARNGGPPRLPDMGALYESIRNSLSPHLDQAKVYYKLKRLKSKFFNSAPSGTSNPHELLVRGLSADLWDTELAPPVEDDVVAEEEEEPEEGYTGEDVVGAASLPLVSGLLGEYWRRNGSALSGVSLEKGLALLGAEEGRVAEAKWRRQLDAEMRTQVRRHDLAKEVFGLLIDAVKGLGP